jgi:hypothetical protein
MMVTTEQITAKILDAHHTLGGIDRFYGQVDWGGFRAHSSSLRSASLRPRSPPASAKLSLRTPTP